MSSIGTPVAVYTRDAEHTVKGIIKYQQNDDALAGAQVRAFERVVVFDAAAFTATGAKVGDLVRLTDIELGKYQITYTNDNGKGLVECGIRWQSI